MFTFSKNAVLLLKEFEGFRSLPYLDSRDLPTIGVGSTTYNDSTKVTMKDKPITEEQAIEMCLFHLTKNVLPVINKTVKVELSQNKVDSLASLIYNIGGPQFESSTLLKEINKNGDVKTQWMRWNKVKGKIVNGLTSRRAKEFLYYNQQS